MAKAKVQQTTPVYTVVQPATVPLRPSKPSKVLILVGFVFLAVVAASAWILFGKDMVNSFRNKKSKNRKKPKSNHRYYPQKHQGRQHHVDDPDFYVRINILLTA